MARLLPFRTPSQIEHKQGRGQSAQLHARQEADGTVDLTLGNTALVGGMMRPSRFRTARQRTARVQGLGVGVGAGRGDGSEFLERTYCETAWSLLISRAVCSWSAAS